MAPLLIVVLPNKAVLMCVRAHSYTLSCWYSLSIANVHCYTVSKSIGEDSWRLDQAIGANQYTMAVDKEVKRRQLAGNFNQQKMFALVKLEGAEMPASNAQALNIPKKFVIRRSDVSEKYELEVNKAPPPSDSTRQLSSWNEQAASGEG